MCQNRSSWLWIILTVILSLAVFRTSFTVDAAEPAIPKRDLDKWARRIREFLTEDWAVSASGDTITISRNSPVEFIIDNKINRSFGVGGETKEQREAREQKSLFKGDYRITLRFTEKLSHDRHEELALQNARSWEQVERLRKTLIDITHKFNEYIAENEEEERRLKAYNDTVAKLPFHELPDCYCDEYGIFYNSGWGELTVPYDNDVRTDCKNLEDTLLRLFGTYPATLAEGRWYPQSPDDPQSKAANRGIVKVLSTRKRH